MKNLSEKKKKMIKGFVGGFSLVFLLAVGTVATSKKAEAKEGICDRIRGSVGRDVREDNITLRTGFKLIGKDFCNLIGR